MTSYSPRDLAEDWEFKILRSNSATFRNPAKLRAILDEEKRGGWVLVEKFDNYRIRLKRPAGTKVVEDDIAHPYDPYRTEVGFSSGAILAVVLGASLALLLVTLTLFFVVQSPDQATATLALPQPPLMLPTPVDTDREVQPPLAPDPVQPPLAREVEAPEGS